MPSYEISMVATVVDDGDTVRAEADFESGDRSGPGSPLRLCKDDKLTINGDKPERAKKGDRWVYSITVTDPTSAPRKWTFHLDRKRDGSPIESTVELPPPFQITAPTAQEQISRAADYGVTWQPPNAGGTMQLELDEEVGAGICLQTTMMDQDYKRQGGVQVDDTGTWTITANAVTATDAGADCNAQLRLSRVVDGKYPDALDIGGLVEARVSRFVEIVSAP